MSSAFEQMFSGGINLEMSEVDQEENRLAVKSVFRKICDDNDINPGLLGEEVIDMFYRVASHESSVLANKNEIRKLVSGMTKRFLNKETKQADPFIRSLLFGMVGKAVTQPGPIHDFVVGFMKS